MSDSVPHLHSISSKVPTDLVGLTKSHSKGASDPHPTGSTPSQPSGQRSSIPNTKDNVDVEQNRGLFREIIDLPDAPPALRRFRRAFTYAIMESPHSIDSMKELNIEAIVNNAKLRRDINFEPRLAFRPTEDAEKQRRQKLTKELYAEALAAELETFRFLSTRTVNSNLTPSEAEENNELLQSLGQRRIPKLLIAIKAILKTMVTDADFENLRVHFDVGLGIQEIMHGNCDFVKITQFLGRLLKAHCAPVRDQQIDQVVSQIAKGDINSISLGLVNLLEILELMKLDIANHQVRHLKSYFINWTFPFEMKYHGNRISKGRFNVEPSKTWYTNQQIPRSLFLSSSTATSISIPHKKELQRFVYGFVNSLFIPTYTLPDSFEMDHNRIHAIRNDLLEITQLRACFSVYMSTWKAEFSEPKCLPSIQFYLKSQILNDIRSIASQGGGVVASIPNIAECIINYISKQSGHEKKEMKNDSSSVQNSLKLQLQKIKTSKNNLLEPLFLDVFDVTTEHLNSEYFEIFKRLVPQPPPATKQLQAILTLKGYTAKASKPSRFPEDLTPLVVGQLGEIVNRISHIAILHWKVWSQLVYLDNGAED